MSSIPCIKQMRRRFHPVALALVFSPLLFLLAGCGDQNKPPPIDQQIMTTTTSPIPGARATVLPAMIDAPSGASQTNFCVTTAGYCPLDTPVEAGRNCLCETGAYSYGGTTAAAPETYKNQ